MSTATNESAESHDQSDATAAPDDMRAKFREALERKRSGHVDSAADAAHRDGGPAQGERGRAAGGGRMFRRKSGG